MILLSRLLPSMIQILLLNQENAKLETHSIPVNLFQGIGMEKSILFHVQSFNTHFSPIEALFVVLQYELAVIQNLESLVEQMSRPILIHGLSAWPAKRVVVQLSVGIMLLPLLIVVLPMKLTLLSVMEHPR